MGDVHDARLEAHDAAGWNLELKVRLSLAGVHDGHGATNVTKTSMTLPAYSGLHSTTACSIGSESVWPERPS